MGSAVTDRLRTDVDQLRTELRRISTKALRTQVDNLGTPKTWTPTYVNITKGNGVEVARYVEVNKLVVLHYSLKFGSTTTIDGSGLEVSLPVNAHSSYILDRSNVVGDSTMEEDGGGSFFGVVKLQTVSTMAPVMHWVVSTYSQPRALSATIPTTWTIDDVLSMSAVYEGV